MKIKIEMITSTLMDCVNCTSIVKISFTKWKKLCSSLQLCCIKFKISLLKITVICKSLPLICTYITIFSCSTLSDKFIISICNSLYKYGLNKNILSYLIITSQSKINPMAITLIILVEYRKPLKKFKSNVKRIYV